MTTADLNLRPYATDRQWEILEAIAAAGSMNKAAIALGCARSVVQKAHASVLNKASQQGWAPDYDLEHPIPDGFKLRGSSTLYDKKGKLKIQWIKTEADKLRQHEMFIEMVKAMTDDIPRISDLAVACREECLSQLLTVYPVGDHHMGMLSWGIETGADYDLKIGERLLGEATDYLIGITPKSAMALIAFLGDFLHYDNFEPVTPTSRNQLDADSRFPKMVRAAIRAMRNLIERAAEKHAHVHVIVEIGNHDLSSSIFLMECLHNVYENCPNITIDTSPMHYHYYRFGECLIGTHHGHGAKMAQLPLVMAADRSADWGETNYRYWYTGHVHHSKTLTAATAAQDFVGCTAESFRVLAPMDAWAHQKGYRSMNDMKALVLHKNYGEVTRHIVNPIMLRDGITGIT